MGLKESKEIVSQAINIAIQKGCFNLTEVQTIVKALETLNEAPDVQFGEIKPVE
jgi:hypothetical protein